MFTYTNTNPVFDRIKRNENIFIFYNSHSVFAFACIYLIRHYFKQQTMLDKLFFIPVNTVRDLYDFNQNYRDRFQNKNSRYFFIDCVIDTSSLFTVVRKGLSTHIIDSRTSVATKLFKKISDVPFSDQFNISLHTSKDVSFIGVVWRLLSNSEPPEFIHELNGMYLNPITDAFGVKGSGKALIKIRQDFEAWDDYLQSGLKEYPISEALILSEFKDCLKIGIANSFSTKLYGINLVCINCPRYLMATMAVLCLTSDSFTSVILFEKTEQDYYYEVHSLEANNLLDCFSKFKPHGYFNMISFRSERDILVEKPSFFKRLFGY